MKNEMKKMKILLGNNTLSILGGSETWTYTLAIQLKKMGHDVSCFASELGIFSDKLEDAGIKCYSDLSKKGLKPFSIVLEEEVDHDYDVIIANHNHIVSYLRAQFPKIPIISTIHGIIHEVEGKIAPEHPALNAGVAQFVSVSEEVQDKLKKDYNIDSVIIRNSFDLSLFKDMRPPNVSIKQFLINTNYQLKDDPEITVIREVAKHFGAKLTAIGQNFSQTDDIRKAIESSDVVFGMGRSVLEGMAAGRLGIVHGRWGTGGPMNYNEFAKLRYFNFSGRNSEGKLYTKEEMIEAIETNYNEFNLNYIKDYIAKEHNVILAAEEYIRLARELTGQLILRPQKPALEVDTRRPFKLAKDVRQTS